MDYLKEVWEGKIPPFIWRFFKQTGRGINHFNMINENDSILIGISGGKDSLALALALSIRRKWLPISYDLKAVQIEWSEYPLSTEEKCKLNGFFSLINVPYKIITAEMIPSSFKQGFNCYLCSRNRRRILFQEAQTLGIKKIALGHHLDDFVETTIINLCFRGSFSTMSPVQDFFNGKIKIIRPLCEIKESVVNRISKQLELPVYSHNCPYKTANIRTRIKPVIRELSHIDKRVREHIFNAHLKEKDHF